VSSGSRAPGSDPGRAQMPPSIVMTWVTR